MPIKELRGLGIGRGSVKGAVYIMKDVDGPSSAGKVLVLDYPSVAYAGAIKKSLGFIAEQGGMLSHGCAMALELGLPAIVGVPNATKILTEGDLVEVNAEQGIVKKIG